ncbi:MAG: MutS-related protein [Janthinobacterium lividum]
MALIEEKQAIIQGFLANWAMLADFSYSKLQFQEVRSFLRAVSRGEVQLTTSRMQMTLGLLFSETARYQSRARYTQAIGFLHRWQQRYLLPLPLAQFPPSFRPQLQRLAHFLERFELAAAAKAIRVGRFSAARMVRFARQLLAVGPEVMAQFWDDFHQFEAYWSVAKGMQQRGFTLPTFREGGLELDEFYHPGLARPVRNTFRLSPEERVLVLTGPNMSGKSTLFKAVGLCAYLAHAGVGVPAARCELPFFHSSLIVIDLRDSLRDGYSHFMAEIQHLKRVLETARQPGHTLAIFDELFRGTNVEDALTITEATLQGLAGLPRSWFFVSTHLLALEHRLPALPAMTTYYIDCVLQDGMPRFSYRLQAGWSALKIGQLLFEKEGLYELLQPATS